MGKITIDQHSLVCSYLRILNPRASDAEIGIYADYHRSYSTATANIREHGEIVQHPRTASPITNPYMEVRDRAVKMLRTIKLQTGKLTASPLFAVALMDGGDKPDSPDDFFGCPGKTAREAVDEALELFEGDEFAHVIDPDGVETTIELAPRT